MRKVNDACGAPFLSGLSTKTIERWANEHGNVSLGIVEVTKKIALRARLDADASRDVFDTEEAESAGSINGLLIELDKELASAR